MRRAKLNSHASFARLCVVSIAALVTQQALAATPTAVAKFMCHDGKTIAATFYADAVELKLSDGRSLKLPQAMSGSGARYANKDEGHQAGRGVQGLLMEAIQQIQAIVIQLTPGATGFPLARE